MRTFVVTPSRSGLYGLLPRQDWQALVARSVDSWNQGLARCCSVRLSLAPAVDRRLAEQDNLNLVILRRGPWCHNERCGKASTFPLTVLGMTNTYPKDAVGAQVREADIEINATHLHHSPGAGWVLALPGSDREVSLQAVVTHEIGHLLGLRDACGDHYGRTGRIVRDACPEAQRSRVMFGPAQLHFFPGRYQAVRQGSVTAPDRPKSPLSHGRSEPSGDASEARPDRPIETLPNLMNGRGMRESGSEACGKVARPRQPQDIPQPRSVPCMGPSTPAPGTSEKD